MKTKSEQIAELKAAIDLYTRQYEQARREEMPYDVANGSRSWTQADNTPAMDQAAQEIGIMEAELKELMLEQSKEAAAQQRKSEVEMLKLHWLSDPIWDLEYTDGFEDVRAELYTWKIEQINNSKAEWFKKINDKAFQLNCSYSLADYILNLEDRIKGLERRLNNE